MAHLILMLDDDRHAQQRERPMHPCFASIPAPYSPHWTPSIPSPRPSPDIEQLGTGLAGRAANGVMGHDSLDRWRATDALIRAAGLDPDVWGICPTCDGDGSVEAYPGQRAHSAAWTPSGPPVGEGWQLWETVTEGSPVSPVFGSAEGLAHWLTTPAGGDASGPSRIPMTLESARTFVARGWAPTGVITAGGVHDGAHYVGTRHVLSAPANGDGGISSADSFVPHGTTMRYGHDESAGES
jgi:hypothetical protein